MQTRRLGKTGFDVTEVGLGCWQLGGEWGPVGEEQALGILRAATEAGIGFLDTADVYGGGRSEVLVGRHTAHLATRPIVATKVGRTDDLYPDGYEADRVRDHLKQSQDRLGVDRLDLVQLHCVPPAELEAGRLFEIMDAARDDGLCANWGASVETIAEARTCLDAPGCASLQIIFNIFRQDAAHGLLPEARDKDVGIIVRLPLASGLLTGKFNKDSQFAETDHRNFNRDGDAFSVGETFSGLPFDRGVELAERVRAIVDPGEASLAQAAIRWLLDHDAVSTVIAGASKPEQARANAAASDMAPLSADTHDALAALYRDEVKPLIKVPV